MCFFLNGSIDSNYFKPSGYKNVFFQKSNSVLECFNKIFLFIIKAKVYKFNKNANSPDALIGTNTSAGSLGLMQPGGNVAELLEKQVRGSCSINML